MEIAFVAGVATITSDPAASAALYRDALGLPLEGDGDYLSTGLLGGTKHFGAWPLSAAAQSCFGSDTWPDNIPIPQATIEFELRDTQAVTSAAQELKEKGYDLLHETREEPWGQTVARFLSPEGLLIGLSYAPWLHE